MGFLADESGAVTVDWTVLTAAIVGLGITSVAAVRTGTNALGDDVSTSLSNASVANIWPQGAPTFTFDDVTGLARTGWGWVATGSYDGWTATGAVRNFEIVQSPHRGVASPDGRNFLDLEASPGNMAIARTLDGLTAGQSYSVSFNAADAFGTSPTAANGVEIYFGGELVGRADPGTNVMQNFSFDFEGGSGDGSNQLELRSIGNVDGVGVYLHDIQVR